MNKKSRMYAFLALLMGVMAHVAFDMPIEWASLGLFPLLNVDIDDPVDNPPPVDLGDGGDPAPTPTPESSPKEPELSVFEKLEAEKNSLVELTNKQSNEDDDPEPSPKPADPKPADPKPGEGEDPKPTGTNEETVQVNGVEYFYHPDVHAKGEDVHRNVFKTREHAEQAAVAKIDTFFQKLDELKELNSDVGAIALPEELEQALSSEDARYELADLERFVTKGNDDLRSTLKDYDKAIKAVEAKITRVKERVETQQKEQASERKYNEAVKAADNLIKKLNVRDRLSQDMDNDSFVQLMEEQVEARVTKQLDKDVKDLQAFIDEQDANPTMSIKEFIAERDRRLDAIDKKRSTLTAEYDADLNTVRGIKQVLEEREAKAKSTLSPDQLRERAISTFEEFKADLPNLPIFDKDAPETSKAFRLYALRPENMQKFNNYATARNWKQAYDAYNSHLAALKAKRVTGQTGKPSGAPASGTKPEPRKPDASSPVNQTSNPTTREKIQQELSELVRKTNSL